jgi:hypothetical protein
MSEVRRRDAIARMALDEGFRMQVRTQPEAVARELGISTEEMAQLAALADGDSMAGAPQPLGERLSKSAILGGNLLGSLLGGHDPDVAQQPSDPTDPHAAPVHVGVTPEHSSAAPRMDVGPMHTAQPSPSEPGLHPSGMSGPTEKVPVHDVSVDDPPVSAANAPVTGHAAPMPIDAASPVKVEHPADPAPSPVVATEHPAPAPVDPASPVKVEHPADPAPSPVVVTEHPAPPPPASGAHTSGFVRPPEKVDHTSGFVRPPEKWGDHKVDPDAKQPGSDNADTAPVAAKPVDPGA